MVRIEEVPIHMGELESPSFDFFKNCRVSCNINSEIKYLMNREVSRVYLGEIGG